MQRKTLNIILIIIGLAIPVLFLAVGGYVFMAIKSVTYIDPNLLFLSFLLSIVLSGVLVVFGLINFTRIRMWIKILISIIVGGVIWILLIYLLVLGISHTASTTGI